MTVTVIVPTWNGSERIARLLPTIAGDHQTIVVDNGSTDGTRDLIASCFPGVEVIALPRNEGFSRAVNIAAAAASGERLVLVNDDCECRPGFVAALAAGLDPARSVAMAAGVLLEAHRPQLIDTAGMELDGTLLVFDYLNGRPVDSLGEGVPPPLGPSGAASAFLRDAFLAAGGFDERLFAYWEDVDLVLRLRLDGLTCSLVPGARALHAHSSTLGSGSREKNYLTGFGRGYTLRKWSVADRRRLAAVLARDAPVCLGQLLIDRNAAGIRGRIQGYRAAAGVEQHAYPAEILAAQPPSSARSTLARRARRRIRLSRGA